MGPTSALLLNSSLLNLVRFPISRNRLEKLEQIMESSFKLARDFENSVENSVGFVWEKQQNQWLKVVQGHFNGIHRSCIRPAPCQVRLQDDQMIQSVWPSETRHPSVNRYLEPTLVRDYKDPLSILFALALCLFVCIL